MESKTPLSKKPAEETLLPGVIGATLSTHVAAMQSILHEFRQTRRLSRAGIDALQQAVAASHRIAVQSQQLTRLAAGRLRQSHERLRLDSVIVHLIEDEAERLASAGKTLQQRLDRVEVIVDPGLLVNLLQSALEWVSERSKHLQITLSIEPSSENALLQLQGTDESIELPASLGLPSADSLPWFVLNQHAQAMGVRVERRLEVGEVMLGIEFPRTAKHLEGLSTVEMEAGNDSLSNNESQPLAGHQILLITDDETLALEMRELCEPLGLQVTVAANGTAAAQQCLIERPHIVMVDEQLRDDAFDELRENVLRDNGNFPFIEIATASDVVELSDWLGNGMSRIGRRALRTQLPPVLIMELAKGA